MNSAVEPLLKAINDLKNKVEALEIKVEYLERDVNRLRNEIPSSTSNITSVPYGEYTWSSHTSERLSQYGATPTPVSITDIRIENGNLLATYSDGRVETINPVL